ncbi:MAG: hypothetical protein HKN92_04005, partial [Chitinophagales bacterium]|nr:hypothetical protein [Chitinophagales bacterium]
MDILVTGIGAKCALGENTKMIWESIAEGKCGISPITRFDVSPFRSSLGAEVQSGDNYSCEKERLISYGCSSAKEALSNASIESTVQIAMVIGTCNGIIGEDIHEISKSIAEELGINGIVLTISTACASSTHAIG